MRNRFGAIILNESMLYKWETIVAKGETLRDQTLEKVSQFVIVSFKEARAKGFVVHDRTIGFGH